MKRYMCNKCDSWVGICEDGTTGDLHIWCDTCGYDVVLELKENQA